MQQGLPNFLSCQHQFLFFLQLNFWNQNPPFVFQFHAVKKLMFAVKRLQEYHEKQRVGVLVCQSLPCLDETLFISCIISCRYCCIQISL